MRRAHPGSKTYDPQLSDEALFLQPWYVPRSTYLAIRSLVPLLHIQKMRFYFEDWGCIRCQRKNVLYGSNGFCEQCDVAIRGRVTNSLKRRMKESQVLDKEAELTADDFAFRMTSAQRILRKGGKPK